MEKNEAIGEPGKIMRKTLVYPLGLLGGLLLMANQIGAFGGELRLNIQREGAALKATWPARALRADGTTASLVFELQRSADLKEWSPAGPALQGGVGDDSLSADLPGDGAQAFFRVLGRFSSDQRMPKLAQSGAETFGYVNSFSEELAALGQITPEQFAALYPGPTNYLAGLDWDPTTADFWPKFNVDPAEYNLTLLAGVDHLRKTDFRLNTNELAAFKKNGFVVSERLGAPSPGELFSRIWTDVMPVFIASDPILYAWHRNYDMMLSELEETYLFENVRQMLEGMASKVGDAAALAAQTGTGPLKESVLDADYMVTVARSLLGGVQQVSALGQDSRVAATLAAVAKLELIDCFDLFGQPRAVDFSQFKPRGHYTESARLGRYFQCVMWLGRLDLRVAGGPYQDAACAPAGMAPPRELGTAIVLNYLLNASGQFGRWQQFDHLLQTFVGWTDSMTFAQLGEVLRAAGIQTLADVRDTAALEALQNQLVAGVIGVKNIRSDWFNSPLGADQIQLPHSFTIFGQKFVLDSWALGQTVFDSILWDGAKVPRRVPSALDVAFSVFGNNQVVPELVARIQDQSPTRHLYRDGFMYQHNLAATRAVIDHQSDSVWGENLYMSWLGTLRELSVPATDPAYPDALRTQAWAMKDLNTQLASWTQIRHDTVLYAEQSYTGGGNICSYPAGFVEPRPAFWGRLRQMAQAAATLIQNTDYSGTAELEIPAGSGNVVKTDLKTIQARQVASMRSFADTAGTLLGMSERELRHEPFTKEQEAFLQNTMYAQVIAGYTGIWWEVYEGWYPKLFYRPLSKELPEDLPRDQTARPEADFQFSSGALKWDALVTDVHTDVPCTKYCVSLPDPGSVLHEGTGRAHLLMIAINNGADRCVYAGPVMSHYEFELIGPPTRLSDPEWKDRWLSVGFHAQSWQTWPNTPAGDGVPD
ncbi:MAG: leucine-rich repeat protein, partial [Verrucomicrobiales bacterium]|nr:leucine-rich repeat protein [Verrucomicrobiales bacterium]